MYLIVGLGNPGREYDQTRHNIGFIALDMLVDEAGESWQNKDKFSAQVATSSLKGQKLIYAKPTTYMNLSGRAVAKIAKFYKISVTNILVIYDEIDLKPGQIKYKVAGGAAGHNGIRSIDAELGDKNYHRLRVGIGRPANSNIPVSDYVLGKFSQAELTVLVPRLEGALAHLELIFAGKPEEFKAQIAT